MAHPALPNVEKLKVVVYPPLTPRLNPANVVEVHASDRNISNSLVFIDSWVDVVYLVYYKYGANAPM